VIVNPEHISLVEEAEQMNSLLKEGKIDIGLNEHVRFSKVSMLSTSGFDSFVVIGTPNQILEKLNRQGKSLLKG
tara:strand:- start:270 stop:491 length:222 start_codon:yes stop_codon:yes gene_type:complete